MTALGKNDAIIFVIFWRQTQVPGLPVGRKYTTWKICRLATADSRLQTDRDLAWISRALTMRYGWLKQSVNEKRPDLKRTTAACSRVT